MRRRLLLARGLVHEPKLILLDEPTVGLDPQIRTELWTLIGDLKAGRDDDPDVDPLHRGGRTAGRRGGGDGGRQDHQPRPSGRPDRRARRPPDRRGLRAAGAPRQVRAKAEGAGLRVRAAGPAVAIVGSERAENGTVPEDAVVRAATLEDVFVLLTGEEAE